MEEKYDGYTLIAQKSFTYQPTKFDVRQYSHER